MKKNIVTWEEYMDRLFHQDVKYTMEALKKEQEGVVEKDECKYIYHIIPVKRWHSCYPWGYESQKLYKMIGWEFVELVYNNSSHTSKTGALQVERTSANTYRVSEETKTTHRRRVVGVMIRIRRDRIAIKDLPNYHGLMTEINSFVNDQERCFGENVIPSYFNSVKRFPLMVHNRRSTLLLLLCTWIGTPIYFLYLLYQSLIFKKKHGHLSPKVKEYYKEVERIKEKAKNLLKY